MFGQVCGAKGVGYVREREVPSLNAFVLVKKKIGLRGETIRISTIAPLWARIGTRCVHLGLVWRVLTSTTVEDESGEGGM